jgi:hypothetical protein
MAERGVEDQNGIPTTTISPSTLKPFRKRKSETYSTPNYGGRAEAMRAIDVGAMTLTSLSVHSDRVC